MKVNLISTVKHGGSGVIVWGCMTSNEVCEIEFIESLMNKFD